jgi:hypothetical protein
VVVECSSATHVVDLTDGSKNNQSLFKIDFSRWTDDSDASVLDMRLLYAPEIDSQCRATIATQSCTVRLATVKYSVIRKGTSGALDHTRYPQTLARQLIVANASSNDGAPAVTLAALEYFGHYFLQSSAITPVCQFSSHQHFVRIPVAQCDGRLDLGSSRCDVQNGDCIFLR